jgi:hypothetical protein
LANPNDSSRWFAISIVVSPHLFAIPILVLWVELGKKKIHNQNFNVRNIFEKVTYSSPPLEEH